MLTDEYGRCVVDEYDGDHVGCGSEGNLLCRVCLYPLPGHLFYTPSRNRTLVHPSCVGYRISTGLVRRIGVETSDALDAAFLTESTSVPLVLADLYIPRGHLGRSGCIYCEPPPVGTTPAIVPGANVCKPHENEMATMITGFTENDRR